MKKQHQQRSEARRIALQALYQAQVQGDDFMNSLLPEFIAQQTDDMHVRELAASMCSGAWEYRLTADQWTQRLMPHWTTSRLATVDLNLIRLALWELTQQPETPPKVVLDEAINLAHAFSTQDSASFINGVLNAALQEHLASTKPGTGANHDEA
ncbi:MAG TPA: transcription antitermination factor NusB [Phycisphaerae bacterium]|nr:transcription antitermination factor NusB [Phycisphaerae bacterium]